MNPFIQHPYQQGVSYTEHMTFALSIAGRLLQTAISFTLHAIFPFIDIDRSLDLEATAEFINRKNDWIESAKSSAAGFEADLETDMPETC